MLNNIDADGFRLGMVVGMATMALTVLLFMKIIDILKK